MRLIYPLLWSRLGRQADREQSISTAAALARRGVEVTLMMPRRPNDPVLAAQDLRDFYEVSGDFSLVQRTRRWVSERYLPAVLWLWRVFRDREVPRHDLLYTRMPLAFYGGIDSPIPFAVEHYRDWPDRVRGADPMLRGTANAAHCLGFVLHSAFAAESFRRAGVPEEKLLVAHNGVEPSRMEPRLSKSEARAALGLPNDRPIAVYAGRLNGRKGIDQLLLVADRRPEILFLLVGSEGEGPVEAAARSRANVRVLPWQSPAALPRFLYAADVLVIPPSSAPLERHGNAVLPIKTFSYLAAGRPILAPSAPDTAELLRGGDTAFLVPPDDPDAAAAAFARLVAEPALAERLGANATRLAEGLSWDMRAAKILAFLEARLSRPGVRRS